MGDSFVTNDVGDDGKTSRSFQGFILFNGTSFQVLIMMVKLLFLENLIDFSHNIGKKRCFDTRKNFQSLDTHTSYFAFGGTIKKY